MIDQERPLPADALSVLASVATQAPGRGVFPSVRRSRGHHPRVADDVDAIDIGRAANTIPITVEAGSETCPAVAPALWLVHVRFERLPTAQLGASLVQEYTPMARRVADRTLPHRSPDDDVDAVTMAALIGALERFECGRSVPFPRFAVPAIIRSLKRAHG